MTTRCAFKIEDPSLGPGRVDCRAPDEGFGFEGTPKPKIQREPSPPQKRTPYMWDAAVSNQWPGTRTKQPYISTFPSKPINRAL